MSAAVLKLSPRIGRPWAGGCYSGLVDDHHLIAGPLMVEVCDWATATAWARGLVIAGRSDFSLPTLVELAHLGATFPHLFRPEAYWSCQPLPSGPDIWVHHFVHGIGAAAWGRIYPCHAIAVRRTRNSEFPT